MEVWIVTRRHFSPLVKLFYFLRPIHWNILQMYKLKHLKILDYKLFWNGLPKLKGQIQKPHYAKLIIIECKDLGKKCKPITMFFTNDVSNPRLIYRKSIENWKLKVTYSACNWFPELCEWHQPLLAMRKADRQKHKDKRN